MSSKYKRLSKQSLHCQTMFAFLLLTTIQLVIPNKTSYKTFSFTLWPPCVLFPKCLLRLTSSSPFITQHTPGQWEDPILILEAFGRINYT